MFVEHEIDLALKRKKLLRGKVGHDVRQSLKSTLTTRANGMFLWARLQIAHLCDATTQADLLLALRELPSGLKETYDRIWTKIQQQRFSRTLLAEQTLELLLYSVEPMSANAVAEAVTPDDPTYGHENQVVDVALILDVCQSLVVLDSELGILRPLHFTAQAFLKDKIPEHVAHSWIAVNCLRRISNKSTLEAVSKMLIDRVDIIDNFTVYAVLSWPVHISRGNKNRAVKSLERELMTDEALHRLWIEALRALSEYSSRKLSLLLDLLKAYPEYPDASLISACFFGLRSIEPAIDFQPNQVSIDKSNYEQYFSWRPAGRFGYSNLSQILIDWRVAGLVCASEQGHASIVTTLLKCMKPYGDHLKFCAYTCCARFAVANGHVDVLDALMRFKGNLFSHSEDEYYPYYVVKGRLFALAAFRGQRETIALLLNKVAEPVRMLENDLEALARSDNEQAFSLLLSYANSDINLTSALSSAASANNSKVIELILDASAASVEALRIASPSDLTYQPGGQGQKQMPHVFVNGKPGVGPTALTIAAWGDCGAAAKALCRDSRVDLNRRDDSGLNAIQISVLECHTDFLKSILDRDSLDVNVRGSWGETPLILAVRKGHTAAVMLLLNSGKADTSLRDMGGLTAMDIAVMKDHDPIINLLSQGRALAREFLLREEMDEVAESPSIAQPLGRWFQ